MPPHISAILWAQWVSIWKVGRGESTAMRLAAAIPAALWYGIFAALALIAAVFVSQAGRDELGPVLAWSFLALLVYWQAAPILTATRGAALDLPKLLVYPVPEGQLFFIEVLLRITTGAESILLLGGLTAGLLLHPHVPLWAPPVAVALFTAMNLLLSAGFRNLLDRLLSYRRIREFAALAAVILVLLPQVALQNTVPGKGLFQFWSRHPGLWPWTAAGRLAMGDAALASAGVLLFWTALAFAFGRRQFRKRLHFDPSEAASARRKSQGIPWTDRLYRLPAMFLPDPAAAVLEKEIRSLARSPRFRVLFAMGLSFGVLVWFPMARHSSSVGENMPVIVSVYALLLLGEPLLWNVFGYDRASSQYYFAAPVPLSRVLAAKNVAAFLFVFAEISGVLLICAVLPFGVKLAKVGEAYAITLTLTVYLSAAGNLTSIYSPRPANPEQTWGGSAAGKMQFLILLLYPALALPIALAYGARYAFNSDAAFYAVLAAVTMAGVIVLSVATDSAVTALERRKEQFLSALASTGGPVAQ